MGLGLSKLQWLAGSVSSELCQCKGGSADENARKKGDGSVGKAGDLKSRF